MDFLNVWRSDDRSTGWRQAAKVNSIVLATMSITLIGFLIAAATKNGFDKAVFFYDGSCDGGSVAIVNMALHLLINVVSTLVVPSSNFFMQVLNSPSRQELNAAHFKGSWMGIGIPSVRNAFRVSRFKTLCWVCLLLSSIPLHLLFNSTVFQTDRRDSDYHMTIATEKFINGGSYYAPGAGLVQGGFIYWLTYSMPTSLAEPQWFPYLGQLAATTYGAPVNLTDYADTKSEVMKNISAIASAASGWDRLDVSQCKQEYISCTGLKKHRNVVLVVDNDGWKRNDIWHLRENQTQLWDQYVPANQSNHLFYDAQCMMYAQRRYDTSTSCVSNCIAAFGVDNSQQNFDVNAFVANSDWQYPFFNNRTKRLVNGTTSINSESTSDNIYTSAQNYGSTITSGLQPGTFNIAVKYCLAQPVDRVCHIGLSPKLLLAVTMCVIFKTFTAVTVTIVLSRRNQPPLVTLGDVIESFLEKPDRVTVGMSTVGQNQIRRAMSRRKAFIVPGPRQWESLRKVRASVIPVSVWLTSYALFIISISICAYFYNSIVENNNLFGSFFESEENAFIDIPTTFVGGVLLANSPQLLLSFCYLAYNNLFTRLQMAREWSLYSEGYHPLRVTDPKGDQYSTYRLQLPYKYSIPLILISIFLHWLLSNTIYLFISTGGYFGSDFVSGGLNDPSLPANTAIAVGYSGYSLLGLIIVACVLITVPFFLSWKRLPSNMVNIGSNSLALSAACHPSIMSHAVKSHTDSLITDSPAISTFDLPETPQPLKQSYTPVPSGDVYDESPREDGFEMKKYRPASVTTMNQSSYLSLSSRQLLPDRSSEDGEDTGYKGDCEQQNGPFTKLARSKLRWGIVKMPPEWHVENDNEAGRVEHLSFGVKEDDVQPPEPGECYA
ncbi:uncharacterized protein GGS22DRAFT_87675 [Annulohypoxylon maeteangense]|uniref:uncharacterized protein n=1 Tax=Annulohypoxylon maeteangense TaxID=1927788 RepID=UPI002008DE91|nr:uncharacterized protein GGS22DRAFT_87675 [Annulohypoxylon maeteangense]KAI0880270.1 hypothetical protein GGS22DRAFT_87675 [Annulohypoxylon maeteangense]